MTTHLIAFADGLVMGTVTQARSAQLTFSYSQEWLDSSAAYPMSISMPLAPEQYGQGKIEPFLWGLLPDNEIVLGQWARKFHVSPRNAFGLIANVGEDCAGAVQFVRPERLDAVRLGAPQEMQWLDEAAVADRLRALREDQSAWRIPRDTGQFSLAGAQPKTALLLENGRWGVPSDRLPTTHILKPPTGEFDGHAENEHFCLQLARSFDYQPQTQRFGDLRTKSPSWSSVMTVSERAAQSAEFTRRMFAKHWVFLPPKSIRVMAAPASVKSPAS